MIATERLRKTTFRVGKMDCPAEEQLIKMKLEETDNINSLNFNIEERKVTIVHSGDYKEIFNLLQQLKLETIFISSEAAKTFTEKKNGIEKKLLKHVLAINFLFFIVELIAGFLSGSMGLLADGLDMLADAAVYGLALFTVGKSITSKKNVAKVSGLSQLMLAVLGFIEILKRFLGVGKVPVFQTMIIVSILAFAANSVSLYLLQKSRNKEAHIKASTICTSNDVIVNAGVIVAGVLVYFTKSNLPDLIIGIIVFGIVAQGAYRILRISF